MVHASEHGHHIPDWGSSGLAGCEGPEARRTHAGTYRCLQLSRQAISYIELGRFILEKKSVKICKC